MRALMAEQRPNFRGRGTWYWRILKAHIRVAPAPRGCMEVTDDYRIYVLSDGTGQTGKHVLEAAVIQFDQPVMIIRIPHVRTVEQVNELVADAARGHSMIVYTLVSVELRQAVHIAAME